MNIKAGDKIIIFYSFDDIRVRVAYNGTMGVVHSLDNRQYIYYAEDEEQAANHRYTAISMTRVQPYSEKLWRACQTWLEDRKILHARYEKLRKGILPLAPTPSLFDLFGERT